MADKFRIFLQLSAHPPLFFAACYGGSILIAICVYMTGGTATVYANLMYLPIVLAATTSSGSRVYLHTVFSALLVGPFMPLNVSEHLSQSTSSWILRLAIYLLVAMTVSAFVNYSRREYARSLHKDNLLKDAQLATIYALVQLLESRDAETGSHVSHMAILCKLLAEKLSQLPSYKQIIDDAFIETMYKSSPLHDIGKVAIPDKILLKPGKLTAEEFAEMKKHTTIGAEALARLQDTYPSNPFFTFAVAITRYHHERWDGQGYPDRLAGSAIPLCARIAAVADVYDALRAKRVYKPAYSHEQSVKIIASGKGTQFDPTIVSVFMDHCDQIGRAYDAISK